MFNVETAEGEVLFFCMNNKRPCFYSYCKDHFQQDHANHLDLLLKYIHSVFPPSLCDVFISEIGLFPLGNHPVTPKHSPTLDFLNFKSFIVLRQVYLSAVCFSSW